MSDGDIDFSRYSLEQLVGILKRIDQGRYPLNYRNARKALRDLWPEAPEDLRLVSADKLPVPRAPMQVLADGTRRFAVHFAPPRPAGPGEPAPNDQRLGGSGRVDVGAAQVSFAELRNGSEHRMCVFAMADIANVEWSEIEGVVVIRTRDDDRHVAVWLQLPEEAAALKDLLPTLVTPEFTAQRRHEADFSQRLRAVAPHAPVVPTIIGLNVLMFAILVIAGAGLMAANPEVQVRFGSNLGVLTWTGQPWRLLTSAFLHFGVIHLAFNMYALYNGGLLTEKLYGSTRFLIIYLLSALAGSVVSGWWDPARNSAGASGAVFGVYGALLAFFAVRRRDIPVRLLKSAGKGALLLCGYSLAIGATSPLIDNACHVGGLLGGAASGWLLARPFDIEARRRPQPGRVALAVVAVVAALALLAVPLWTPGGSLHAEVQARREMQDFPAQESRLVSRFEEISAALRGGQLDARRAGERIEQEVLAPWRAATQPLLAIDAAPLPDEQLAKTLAVLQRYIGSRDRAMFMTAENLKGTGRYSERQLNEAWQEVRVALAELSSAE